MTAKCKKNIDIDNIHKILKNPFFLAKPREKVLMNFTKHFFNGKIGLVVLLIKNIWDHYANLKKGTLPLNLVKKQYLRKEEGAGYIWSCMYLKFS